AVAEAVALGAQLDGPAVRPDRDVVLGGVAAAAVAVVAFVVVIGVVVVVVVVVLPAGAVVVALVAGHLGDHDVRDPDALAAAVDHAAHQIGDRERVQLVGGRAERDRVDDDDRGRGRIGDGHQAGGRAGVARRVGRHVAERVAAGRARVDRAGRQDRDGAGADV